MVRNPVVASSVPSATSDSSESSTMGFCTVIDTDCIGSADCSKSIRLSGGCDLLTGIPGARISNDTLVQVSSRVKAGITADLAIDEMLLPDIKLNSILTTVWDIIPYSFLVDWVINVQDWLLNLQPKPMVRQQVGYIVTTHHVSVVGHCSWSDVTGEWSQPVLVSGNTYRRRRVAHRSYVIPYGFNLLAISRQRVEWKPSGIKLTFTPFSWINGGHIADLLALSTQLKTLRGLFRKI